MSELQKTDILAEIIQTKRQELAARVIPLEGAQGVRTKTVSLRQALMESPTGIIAEFKRKSPSRGWIHADARPEEVVPAYAAAGATALSILTDETYFGGSLDFIRRVRPLVDLPILRKDFIIDPVQLVEARQAGADAVLLIAACLGRGDCAALTAEAHRLGLEVLLEIHSAGELDYVTPDVDVVGVNNRHLGSFVTDVRTSFGLAPLLSRIPGEPVLVSESGLGDPATVRALRDAGFRGFLMGEHFMKQTDPGAALATLIQAL